MYSGKPLMEVFLRHESSQYRPGVVIWRVAQLLYKVRFAGMFYGIMYKQHHFCRGGASCARCSRLNHNLWWSIDTFSSWYKFQGWSFGFYIYQFFCPRDRHELKRSSRVDIIWDQYLALTRGKEGQAPTIRICDRQNTPGN